MAVAAVVADEIYVCWAHTKSLKSHGIFQQLKPGRRDQLGDSISDIANATIHQSEQVNALAENAQQVRKHWNTARRWPNKLINMRRKEQVQQLSSFQRVSMAGATTIQPCREIILARVAQRIAAGQFDYGYIEGLNLWNNTDIKPVTLVSMLMLGGMSLKTGVIRPFHHDSTHYCQRGRQQRIRIGSAPTNDAETPHLFLTKADFWAMRETSGRDTPHPGVKPNCCKFSNAEPAHNDIRARIQSPISLVFAHVVNHPPAELRTTG